MAETLKARLLDSDRRGAVVDDLQTFVDTEVADPDRPLGVAAEHGLPGPSEQPLEASAVDLCVVHCQQVAAGRGLDGRRAEPLAEARDAPVDDLRGGGRRVVAPQHVRQGVGAARVVRTHQQRREHHAVPRTEAVGLAVHLERAEYGDTHAPTVDPAPADVNRVDTSLIPDRQVGDTRPWAHIRRTFDIRRADRCSPSEENSATRCQ